MSSVGAKGLAASALMLLPLLLLALPETVSSEPSPNSVFALMPQVISTRYSLECQNVWSRPSSSNDIMECITDMKRLKRQWRYLVFPAVNLLLLLTTLISFPIVFMCVTSCSSSCKQDSKADNSNARCWLWMWVMYALLWSVGVAFLVIFGAKELMKSAPRLIDDVQAGPMDYFNTTAERIIDFTSDWSTGERKPLEKFNFDISTFTKVQSQVQDVLNDSQEKLLSHLDMIAIASYVFGGVSFATMLFMLCIGWLRCCIPFMPLLTSCLYWILGMLFASLAVIVTLLTFLISTGCGEVDLQYEREPGVFQWYLVPYCNKEFNFRAINEQVREAEVKLSNEACEEVLQRCDNNPNVVLPPLNCGQGITSPDQCASLEDLLLVVDSTTVKSSTMLCPVVGQSCTLAECAKGCRSSEVRAVAAKILEAAMLARNASIALTYARPLLECNFIVDKVASSLTSCNDLRTGTFLLGTGFFVGGLMFGLAIYVMFRGSCVWGDPSAETDPTCDPCASSKLNENDSADSDH